MFKNNQKITLRNVCTSVADFDLRKSVRPIALLISLSIALVGSYQIFLILLDHYQDGQNKIKLMSAQARWDQLNECFENIEAKKYGSKDYKLELTAYLYCEVDNQKFRDYLLNLYLNNREDGERYIFSRRSKHLLLDSRPSRCNFDECY